MSVVTYKPMIKTFNDPKFYPNGLCFETKEEAEKAAQNTFSRWLLAEAYRADESSDPVNYRWVDGEGPVSLPVLLVKSEEPPTPYLVRMVFKGDKYGLNFCLTHEQEEPLVEFYDTRRMYTIYGLFVSSYYASTLLGIDGWSIRSGRTDLTGQGLDLMGYAPEWKVDGAAMDKVRTFVAHHVEKAKATP